MSHVESTIENRRILSGLLWYDWRRHRMGIVLGLGVIAPVMFAVGIAEPYSAGMFLVMTTTMAFSCGLGFGRAEWIEGHEEFALSWPATRDQRFFVRLALGSVFLGAMYLIGWLGCYSALPGWLADVFSIDTSGLSQEDFMPFDPGREFLIFAHVAPWLLFVESFVLSMAIERRDQLGWFVELALVVAGALGFQWAAQKLLGEAAPWLVIPILAGFGALRIRLGLRAYRNKEAVLDLGAASPAGAKPMMVLAILLGLTVLASLGLWLFIAVSNG